MHAPIRFKRSILAVAAAFTALAVAALPAATAGAEEEAPKAAPALASGAYFNRLGQDDDSLVDHLVDLINGTPDGESIAGTAYHFDEPRVTDALIKAAKERDVKVMLITDYNAYENEPEVKRLKNAVESQDGDSWVVRCPARGSGTACIGTGAMHNKFFLFSKTGGSKWVVSTTSANLNEGSGRNLFNSTYTHVGNEALYDQYGFYFNDLGFAVQDEKYYENHPPEITGNTKSYFYPRAEGDTVTSTLEEVACPGTIHVGMWSISRSSPTKELRRLADEGCSVQIVAHHIYDQACENLTKPGDGKVTLYGFREGKPYIHQKNMLINATYTGERHQVVFTGSANLNNPSIRENDENVLRIMDEPRTYEAFVGNFNAMANEADYKATTEADCKKLFNGQES
ncbi:phosphatidylserine/phosphatidylglycerophosphate/cardiolipin synthase family protein [Actinomadura sp. 3N508]|uniref:phosphatidylserine/phosphatidylglycerophosphate/ cardiolipin synthase family protein n=1 Tax=Actinomadura sp. 3N508 TaxID=3375153 RepID=UPI0037876D1F